MENKRWQKVETIFHSALGLEDTERRRFLREACAEDESLFGEVESLIVAFDEQADFMDAPTFSLGLKAMAERKQTSLSGRTIKSYRIERKLGSGGMGDVYLAHDTRLNRQVALKFLAPSFIGDESGVKRLIREAQAVAMLDHPNICAVYHIEETDEFQFIVMQYVEGETLSRLMSRKQLNSEQLLPITKQIVEALVAAHAQGIVHRDIKPANIMITRHGQVKVLDFGLAKFIGQIENLQMNGENNSHVSQKGLLLGTIAYMSPEQLRAEEVDCQSDIFSFGILLAELAYGSHPFARESQAETISAILTDEAKLDDKNNSRLNGSFNRIIKKCLEKDKKKRFQSTDELLPELENLKPESRAARFFAVYFRVILVILVLLSVFFVAFTYQRASRVRSLAVLPFANESADATTEYLGDTMAEDFINRLSDSQKLRVKAFTLVSGYKGKDVSPLEIGRELNVDAVLVGKIIRANSQTVLQTKLLDTADGTQLWAAENIIENSSILALQTDSAARIIKRLEPWGNIWTQPDKPRSDIQTSDPEAYNLYWKGRYFWQKRDKENIQKAIGFFNQAIELDPSYARAYAGLADSYVLLSSVAYGSTPTREAMIKAKAAAKKSLELDNRLCEAHTSLGLILLKFDWNMAEAEKEFQTAIELNPEYASAHYWYSVLLSVTGRADEALAEGQKARDLDPFSQLLKINIARIYYFAHRYDEALRTLTANDEHALESNVKTQYMIGLVYIQKEMYAEAILIFENLYAADKSLGGAALGYCYAKTGKPELARQILAELEQTDDYFPAQEKAIVYIGLNEREAALRLLKQSYRERYAPLISINVEPMYKDLHSEPEFIELVKQMSF